jgi:hypothetical protein
MFILFFRLSNYKRRVRICTDLSLFNQTILKNGFLYKFIYLNYIIIYIILIIKKDIYEFTF